MKPFVMLLIGLLFASAANGGMLLEQGKNMHHLFPLDQEESRFQTYRTSQMPVVITKLVVDDRAVMSNDDSLMSAPSSVCSGYDKAICHSVSKFYQSNHTPMLISGLYFMNPDEIVQFGMNTGFDSSKLTVAPSAMLGFGKRIHLNKKRTAQIVLNGYKWVGGQVTHRACQDSFDREYFCGNLTAWSDFSWDENPQSYAGYVSFTMQF